MDRWCLELYRWEWSFVIIYLLSTNRSKWCEFAYRQYKRFNGYSLVVLDNTQSGISFWKEKADFHYHLPELENVSQMYNWFLSNHPLDNIFYADDDVEYHPDLRIKMEKYLEMGWDFITNCNRYVSNSNGSSYFDKNPIGVGSGWMASKHILKLSKFKEDTVDGICSYVRDLIVLYKVNVKTIYERLQNLIVHDSNVLQRESHFKFELPRINWDNTKD